MLTFSEIIELKNSLQKNFGAQLHFHDVCPKPFFTLDKTDNETAGFICSFLGNLHHQAIFSSDGLHFTVKRKTTE